MDWLVPAVVATLSATIFLTFIFLFIYIQDQRRYLAAWTLSWAIYALRFVFLLLQQIFEPTASLVTLQYLATLLSGVLLMYGTYLFSDKKYPLTWNILAAGAGAWTVFVALMDWPVFWVALVTFIYLGVVYLWTGVTFLRNPVFQGLGKNITGWAFIIWGLHKLDYPLLYQAAFFAPLGYALSAVLEILVAFGMIDIYYRHARQALRHRESRLTALIENAAIGITLVDTHGIILEANQTLARMLELELDQLIGRNYLEFSVDEDAPAAQTRHTGMYSGALGGYQIERRFKRVDGSAFWGALSVSPVCDDEGKVELLAAMIVDLSERKAAEMALERKSIQQTRLIETARHLPTSLDPKDVLVRIAEGAQSILNAYGVAIYLLEEDGQTLRPVVVIDPEYEDEIINTPIQIENSLTGQSILKRQALIFNNPTEQDYSFQIPGTPVETDERVIVAPFITNDSVLGALCVNRFGELFSVEDLALGETFASYATTAIKNAQDHEKLRIETLERLYVVDALRESEARYRSMFEDNHSVKLIIDQESGNILDANPAACRYYGFAHDVMVGMPYERILVQQEPISATEAIDSGGMKGYSLGTQRLANGDLRHVEIYSSPTIINDQQLQYVIVHDVTARIQREREMETIVSVAKALRTADGRLDMPAIILQQVMELLSTDGASLCLLDKSSGEVVVELGLGNAAFLTGSRLPPGVGVCGHIIKNNRPYMSKRASPVEGSFSEANRENQKFFGGIPLVANYETIGALVINRDVKITADDIRLLSAIGEITANALQRASLHEQTQSNLERLKAMHTIDKSITSAIDLADTLGVVLEQALDHLGVDAAAILTYDLQNNRLHYAAHRGDRLEPTSNLCIDMEDCFAERIAATRQAIHLPNLEKVTSEFSGCAQEVLATGYRAYYGIPLIAKDQVRGVLELFRRHRSRPTPEWLDFLDTLAEQAAVAIDNSHLFRELQQSHLDIVTAYDTTLAGWAHALELRDKETQGHARRVLDLVMELSRRLGMPESEMVHLRRGALLHDIGKMGIPDNILLKPGPLNEAEWEVMRKHPVFAYELLSEIDFLKPALDIPYAHHERWDGSGYPRGLKGQDIPLAARIFAVVDVWDAITSNRPYREAWTHEKAIEYLQNQSGYEFDPAVVAAFLDLLSEYGETQADGKPIISAVH